MKKSGCNVHIAYEIDEVTNAYEVHRSFAVPAEQGIGRGLSEGE